MVFKPCQTLMAAAAEIQDRPASSLERIWNDPLLLLFLA
jgi:hypothetical protein